ncbi:hypothetical protein N7489_011656 [Penicillium chrysogenum]|uniref:uncharacterized protein n=1 Tax=Penicillium chrysogenum TaxID=5076 RepID=UPI0024DF11D2|nr:uncharacterized protein N7489_011656 [Penicillium chrysogenum]KAJ5230948.1 hypothetical protein N7489_011656 [Penicillium chrysogenum]
MWYSHLVADGCFIPLLTKLLCLSLPTPSHAEKFFGNITELRLQILTGQTALSREWSTFDGLQLLTVSGHHQGCQLEPFLMTYCKVGFAVFGLCRSCKSQAEFEHKSLQR